MATLALNQLLNEIGDMSASLAGRTEVARALRDEHKQLLRCARVSILVHHCDVCASVQLLYGLWHERALRQHRSCAEGAADTPTVAVQEKTEGGQYAFLP